MFAQIAIIAAIVGFILAIVGKIWGHSSAPKTSHLTVVFPDGTSFTVTTPGEIQSITEQLPPSAAKSVERVHAHA